MSISEPPSAPDWPFVPLIDMAEVNPESLSAGTAPDFRFQYIDLSSVERGEIDFSSVQEITFASAPSRARRLVRPGDVLFGTVRPALQSHGAIPAGWVDGTVVASTGFSVIRARRGTADQRFMFHMILSDAVTSEARRVEVGSNYPAVNEADVRRFRLPKPPLPEQHRIAEILDTVDQAIRSTEQLIAKLELVKHGLLCDLLTRGVDDNGELRDPLRHPEQFQNTAIGRIPRGWEVRSTVDAAARSAGSTTIGPFGSNLLASDYRREGVPVVFVRDIREDGFVWTSGVYVSATKARSLSAHAVEPGDVVITKMGLPSCVAAVYPSWMPLGIVTADVIRLRPHPTEIRADWISAFLNSDPVRAQVRAITAGVTRPKVTLADFRKLQIAVPPVTEQDAILARAQASAQRLRCEMYEVGKLRYLKLGLSNDILTGRVRVTPLREGDAA